MRAGELIGGRFRVEAEVASGGMGRIARARDEETGALVALKVIATEDPSAEERFAREAKVLASVRHPALVDYVASGRASDGAAYLAMEWLEGIDLRVLLGRRGDLTMPAGRPSMPVVELRDALVIAERVASALGELHRHGIVHRDVKPGNVFLVGGRPERAKLLDLGAAALGEGDHLTATGMLVGTPAYMAPEQVRAEGAVGPSADVWSVGCLLYECLTGFPAFRGNHVMALLARILLDEPPSLAAARPDLPAAVHELAARALARSPRERFEDGAALALAIAAVDPAASSPARVLRAHTPSLGGTERRVRSVVLGSLAALPPETREEVRRACERAGGALCWLSPGSFVVTVEPPASPVDQATQAARIALALRHAAPGLALAIATGHAESDGRIPVGDAVDRAATLLGAAERGAVQVDPATAPLLEARFDLAQAGASARLVGERAEAATRTLLGKPTLSVGRKRELGVLLSMFDHGAEEQTASVAVVTAPAGTGKTRLRSDLLRELRRRGEALTVIEGQGDSLSAGSPFVMIAPALRRWADVRDGEAPERAREQLRARLAAAIEERELDRVWVFLSELIGAPHPDDASEELRAARQDPMLLGDSMRRAFADWIAALCRRHPVLLVLEDLHWGDLPSVRFVDAALARAEELPLMVLALARPEVHARFPELFGAHGPQELKLGALSKRASAQLVRQVLGDGADDALVAAIAERAGGNAFYLEELIRAAAEGSGELPDSVIAMVQTRLDALGQDAKRVLRAASVFGEVFWTGGVEALLGEGAIRVGEWLEELARREVVGERAESRFPAEREWRFRHALVRDGAYALLTSEDRSLGHRLAGAWLSANGEPDAAVLAEHFDRGGERAEAVRWFRRAADQALEGNDLSAVIERVERAAAAGASGSDLGALRALESLARYWQSDYAGAKERGEAAAELLEPGSRHWYRALGSAIVASARLGDFASVDASFARVVRATPQPGELAEQLIALSRGTFQLIFHGRFTEADEILARIAEHAGGGLGLDALTLGQVHHVQGVRAAMVGDVSTFLDHLERAVDAFERAGDVRNASLERTTVAWCHAELGDFARAESLCRDNLARCEAMGAQQAITYAKVNLGYILTHRPGMRTSARAVLEEAIRECAEVGNPRLQGWALAHLASVMHLDGRHEDAERAARRASELLVVSPGLHAWARASLARALAMLERGAEALPLAEAAMETLARLGGMLQGESLPPLALAMAREAVGDGAGALSAIEDARARLLRRAERIAGADRRASFLTHPDNRAIELWSPR